MHPLHSYNEEFCCCYSAIKSFGLLDFTGIVLLSCKEQLTHATVRFSEITSDLMCLQFTFLEVIVFSGGLLPLSLPVRDDASLGPSVQELFRCLCFGDPWQFLFSLLCLCVLACTCQFCVVCHCAVNRIPRHDKL